jgi:hypothetical protein
MPRKGGSSSSSNFTPRRKLSYEKEKRNSDITPTNRGSDIAPTNSGASTSNANQDQAANTPPTHRSALSIRRKTGITFHICFTPFNQCKT